MEQDTQIQRFDALYARESTRLVVQLHALTGDHGTAQECVQEAFARAWQRWSVVSGYDDPAAWVRRVARNLAVSRWRRARRLVVGHVPAPSTPGPDSATEDFVRALQALPAAQREALVLHHLAGLDVARIAADAGVTEEAIRQRLSRGRRALDDLLASEESADV